MLVIIRSNVASPKSGFDLSNCAAVSFSISSPAENPKYEFAQGRRMSATLTTDWKQRFVWDCAKSTTDVSAAQRTVVE